MNFSTNQVMHFYVAEGDSKGNSLFDTVTRKEGGTKLIFTNSVSSDNPGENVVATTDVIDNILWATITTPEKQNIHYTKAEIKLDTAINGGSPEKGVDYFVRVSYPEVGGLGVEGWTTKTVSARATTATDLYKALAKELNIAFSNDGVLIASSNASGVTITQKDPTKNYEVGVAPIVMTPFVVSAPKVVVKEELVQPFKEASFKVVKDENSTIPNGYVLADMEYFALGERGDQYRNLGWPDVIRKSKDYYKVDPTEEYYVLNVHYAHKGDNANAHLCEKDLVIASTSEEVIENIARTLGVLSTEESEE